MGRHTGLIGRILAGVGGAALAASLFLSWYSVNLADFLRAAAGHLPAPLSSRIVAGLTSSGGVTFTWSAWYSVRAIGVVLLIIGLAALLSSLALSMTIGPRYAWVVLASGLVAVVLAADRIASPPGSLKFSVGALRLLSPARTSALISQFVHVSIGAWLAVLGGGLVALGGLAQLRRTRPRGAVSDSEPLSASAATPGSR